MSPGQLHGHLPWRGLGHQAQSVRARDRRAASHESRKPPPASCDSGFESLPLESTRNHSCNKTIRQTDILSDHVSNLLFHTRSRTPSPSFPTPSPSKAFWASDSDGHVTHTGHKTPTGRTLRFPFVSRHPEGEDVTSPSSSANQTFLITPPPPSAPLIPAL